MRLHLSSSESVPDLVDGDGTSTSPPGQTSAPATADLEAAGPGEAPLADFHLLAPLRAATPPSAAVVDGLAPSVPASPRYRPLSQLFMAAY